MNILMYYIMTQRIDMRLIASRSTVVKRPRTNIMNGNTMIQPSHQRMSPFGGNILNGNMNGVFTARGRPCG